MTGLARRRFVLATGYVLAGLGVLAATAAFDGRFPTFWRWVLFAIAFAVLEYNSVEVNDRMFQSSSVMVVLTAGHRLRSGRELGGTGPGDASPLSALCFPTTSGIDAGSSRWPTWDSWLSRPVLPGWSWTSC